jgi:hypothetical protein
VFNNQLAQLVRCQRHAPLPDVFIFSPDTDYIPCHNKSYILIKSHSKSKYKIDTNPAKDKWCGTPRFILTNFLDFYYALVIILLSIENGFSIGGKK